MDDRMILAGWVGEWTPGIGDPTIAGWITVVAYLLTAATCLRAFKRQKRTPDEGSGWRVYVEAARSCLRAFQGFKRPIGEVPVRARMALLWLILGCLFVFLGINKQLDLQSMFTEIGKIVAKSGGWYERRREVQGVFVLLVAVTGALAGRGIFRLARDRLRELRLALLGTAFTLSFIVIRAASFHHFDVVIGTKLLGVEVNVLLELGGIACVFAGSRREAEVDPSALFQRLVHAIKR